MRLIDELNQLHDLYAAKVDDAVSRDDLALAEQLGQGYEDDAVRLMAEREGLGHLLPRPGSRESVLRGVVRRLQDVRAA
jgi:hypothetical protein